MSLGRAAGGSRARIGGRQMCTAYSEDAFLDERIGDDLIWNAWRDHVEQLDLVTRVTAAHREHVRAGKALDAAVCAAREAGAS